MVGRERGVADAQWAVDLETASLFVPFNSFSFLREVGGLGDPDACRVCSAPVGMPHPFEANGPCPIPQARALVDQSKCCQSEQGRPAMLYLDHEITCAVPQCFVVDLLNIATARIGGCNFDKNKSDEISLIL